MKFINALFNKDSKYNKAVVLVFGAAVTLAGILGYPEVAVKIAAVGSAVTAILVGNADGKV